MCCGSTGDPAQRQREPAACCVLKLRHLLRALSASEMRLLEPLAEAAASAHPLC